MGELIGSGRDGEFMGGRLEKLPDGAVVTVDEVSGYPGYPEAPAVDGAGAEGEGSGGQGAGDEDESVDLSPATNGESPGVEDIVYELGVAAATHGREFDGRVCAELLEQGGPIEDVRLTIAISVLRTGQKLTGDRMLKILEELGFEGEAMVARLARDELAKIGSAVVVENPSGVPGVESAGAVT